MTTTVRISGTDIERLKMSIQIQDAIEQRSTASFVVVDRTGTASYVKGQAVDIFTGFPIPPFIHPLFAGFIDNVSRKKLSPSSDVIYWTINCIDNHYLADKRIAVEVYTARTAKFIVEDLITTYLADEGVTVGEVQTGPTFEETIINYQFISKVLDVLAEKAGFIWYIDKGKRLFFVERTTTDAPFTIATSDIVREGGMASELAESNPSYRNTQYLRGGKGLTAELTEDYIGDGSQVAFALGYPIGEEPSSVKVAAAGQTIGIKNVDTGKDCYWQKSDSVLLFASAPAGAAAIEVKFKGEYPILVLVVDTVAINALKAIEGGTGIVETMADDPATITRDDSLDAAIAKLDKFGVVGKRFTFPIRKWGLEPGQMVTVTYSDYDLSADDLLVEAIDIWEFAPNELRYGIVGIEGPELGDWTGFFKGLADIHGELLDRLTIGESRILHILKQQKEPLALVEAVDSHEDAYPPDTYRWIAKYPDQGASHHVAHEALALSEAVADSTHLTEDYKWDDGTKWGFGTWK